MTLQRLTKSGLMLATLLAASPVHAFEYRSVLETGTLFQAGPSDSSTRLFVVSKYYPVEVLGQSNAWSHVRDAAGQLAWVRSDRLSPRRYVLVTAGRAVLRQSPSETAAALMTLDRSVVLELVEPPASVWVKVRYDGKTVGYLRVQDIWGV